ncbi:MAG: hypothetical protein ABI763_04700 [Bacteroidota bacterium]
MAKIRSFHESSFLIKHLHNHPNPYQEEKNQNNFPVIFSHAVFYPATNREKQQLLKMGNRIDGLADISTGFEVKKEFCHWNKKQSRTKPSDRTNDFRNQRQYEKQKYGIHSTRLFFLAFPIYLITIMMTPDLYHRTTYQP